MNDTLKIIIGIIIFILFADILGFMFWIILGQYPADSFYLGSITTHALRAIISIFKPLVW